MRSLPMAVSVDLDLSLLLDGDRTVEVPCIMEYRADEPFAIHATFRTGPVDVEWVFARDLLVEGLQRFSGEGDIVIRPVPYGRIPLVEIVLNSPSGQAELYVERAAIEHFLRRTYDIVPVGDEPEQVDMDAALRTILDDADRTALPERRRRHPSLIDDDRGGVDMPTEPDLSKEDFDRMFGGDPEH